jgi:putative SOS response-associated peptidase YedK
MCGRFRLSRRKQIIAEHFDAISGEEDWSPRYHIAPTQPVPVTVNVRMNRVANCRDALGTDSVMGERHVRLCGHD